MPFFCRDDDCLRPFNQVIHRTNHERMMHPDLIKNAVIKLIQKIIRMNTTEQSQKKIITVANNKYSYIQALEMSKNPQTEDEKAIFSIFEGIVKDFFLEFPEEGIRELLNREYKIRS